MSDERRITPAQQRAIKWLPKDGSWRVMDKGMGRAVRSLQLCHVGTVEDEGGNFGPRGGLAVRSRLTAEGIKRFANLPL